MRKYIALLAFVLLLIGTFGGCSHLLEGPLRSVIVSEEMESDTAEAQDFDEEFEFVDVTPDRADYEIVHTLTDLNLIDHDLGEDDTLLEQTTLRTLLGRDIAEVLILRDGELDEESGHIFSNNDSWTMGLYYFTRRHETAIDSVLWSLEFDKESGFLEPNSILTVGPVRTDVEEQTAAVVVLEESTMGDVFLHIYMAQNVPGSNEVVLLDVWLVLGFLEAQDERILAELSDHIGMDFHALITEFAGHLLPEEVL